MKKIVAVILTLTCVMAMSLSAFAEAPKEKANKVDSQLREEIQVLKTKLEGLRAQAQGLHDQAAAKRDTIKDLIKTNKEAEATEKLEAAKTLRDTLKAINAEIKNLRDVKKALWEEVKNARTNKDFETVKAKLAQIIQQKSAIIGKINVKLGILDQIIAALR